MRRAQQMIDVDKAASESARNASAETMSMSCQNFSTFTASGPRSCDRRGVFAQRKQGRVVIRRRSDGDWGVHGKKPFVVLF
jgi:hypothetical protein